MSKINKKYIIYIVIIVINMLAIYFIAGNRYIDKMPMIYSENINTNQILNNDFVELYLGRDLVVVVVAIISTIMCYFCQKYIIKSKKSFILYILLFITLTIINMTIYSNMLSTVY